MKKELILKKCDECGALVKVIKDCDCKDCGIICCNKKMRTIKANEVDASFEKHIPVYERKESDIVVTVPHVMEEDHYIEWICFVGDGREETYYLKPGMDASATFKNVTVGTLYSYCNKHGLWEKKID